MVSLLTLLVLSWLPLGCGSRAGEEEDEYEPESDTEAFDAVIAESDHDEETLRGLLPERDLGGANRYFYYTGLAAFIYGFPANVFYSGVYFTTVDETNPETMDFNDLYHATELVGPEGSLVPTPNNDTMYSSSALDLSTEPIVLSVPAFEDPERYYSFQMIDAYTCNFDYVGTRTTGTEAGDYIISGPEWSGEVPAGVTVFHSPTPFVWLLARTLTYGEEDLETVAAIQSSYGVQPLSSFTGGSSPTPVDVEFPPPPFDVESEELEDNLDFYVLLGYAMQVNPPLRRDQFLTRSFRHIGFDSDWSFDDSRMTERQREGLRRAVDDGYEFVVNLTEMPGITQNGWFSTPPNTGEFGINYILRAAVAYKGLGALPAEEASYLTANVDANDESMTGDHSYELTFPTAPPAEAFWSVTMYDFETRLLVENPIDRYSIGNRTPGIEHDSDGALTIQIQREEPAEGPANWLPAPESRFYVVLRLYLPTDEFLSGDYEVPGIERID